MIYVYRVFCSTWCLALKYKCSRNITIYSDEMLKEERQGRGNFETRLELVPREWQGFRQLQGKAVAVLG